MKKKSTLLLTSFLLVSLNLNASEKYSMEEIYNIMCIECHSSNGSGNTDKLTPSMKDQTLQEISNSLREIEKEKGHIIMEHNRGEIIKQGMKYPAEDMAKYMYERFKK